MSKFLYYVFNLLSNMKRLQYGLSYTYYIARYNIFKLILNILNNLVNKVLISENKTDSVFISHLILLDINSFYVTYTTTRCINIFIIVKTITLQYVFKNIILVFNFLAKFGPSNLFRFST